MFSQFRCNIYILVVQSDYLLRDERQGVEGKGRMGRCSFQLSVSGSIGDYVNWIFEMELNRYLLCLTF